MQAPEVEIPLDQGSQHATSETMYAYTPALKMLVRYEPPVMLLVARKNPL
jgi:hypothetical protein